MPNEELHSKLHVNLASRLIRDTDEEVHCTNEKRHPTEDHRAGDAHDKKVASPARRTTRGGRTQRHPEASSSQSRLSAGGVKALAATTLAACLAPGDATEVRVTIAFPDPVSSDSRAWVLAITLAVLLVSMALWSALQRSTWSHLKTFLRSL